MMRLLVKTMGPYAKKFKFKKMNIEIPDGSTLQVLINLLSEKIPSFRSTVLNKDGSLYQTQKLLLNGYDVLVLQGKDTPLTDGDVVAIFPAVFGG